MQQSSGFIIIDRTGSEPKALCVRAYSNWDFPKGRLEANESTFDAAVREVLEETTLTPGVDFTYTGEQAPSITYGTGRRKKTATYFIGERTSDKRPYLPISPELGKPENDEWRWVALAELPDLMPARFAPINLFLQAL